MQAMLLNDKEIKEMQYLLKEKWMKSYLILEMIELIFL